MPNTIPTPTASREETATLLRYGVDLAGDYKNTPTVEDGIWAALVDAVDIMDRAPDQERAWLRSGTRSNFAGPGLTGDDIAAITRDRVLSGMALHDNGTWNRLRRDRDQDQAMRVLDWLRFVRNAKNGDKLFPAALCLLRGDRRAEAAKIYAPDRAPTDRRRVAYEIRNRAARVISTGLGKHHGCKAAILLRDHARTLAGHYGGSSRT